MFKREPPFVSALHVTMSDERLQQKLAQLDAELSSDDEERQEQDKTSTRTRERLAAVE